LRPPVPAEDGAEHGDGFSRDHCGQAEFDQMEQILRHTLTEAQDLV
jgi:hypothetical protein